MVVPTAVAGPTRPAPLLRLERDASSVVGSLTVPLGPSLSPSPGSSLDPGEHRTGRLTTTAYEMVGFTWHGPDPDLRVRTRTAGAWGRWLPAPALTDVPDQGSGEGRAGTRGSQPLWVGPSDGVQVSVRGAWPGDLALVLIDPGELAGDRAASARPALPRTGTARTAEPTAAPRPEILSRRTWGADETWRNSAPRRNRTIKQVHLHHTATGNDYSRRDVPALIRGMYRYHTHDLGWSDIGYNFLVDRFGRSWVGRAGGPAKPIRGAHTLGFNHTSTGIAVIGNFEDAGPRDEVIRAVVRLASWKLDRYDRDPSGSARVYSHGSDRYAEGTRVRLPVIDGHRDTNETACPGQDLYDLLPVIRRRAERRVERF